MNERRKIARMRRVLDQPSRVWPSVAVVSSVKKTCPKDPTRVVLF